MIRTAQNWLFCCLMATLVAWPGAMPAMAVCVGHDHDPHVVALVGQHDESVPHDHQHGTHGDSGIESGCCADDCCVDIPLLFAMDGIGNGPSVSSGHCQVQYELACEVSQPGRAADATLFASARTGPGTLAVRMNC